jgi:hypothetical protein
MADGDARETRSALADRCFSLLAMEARRIAEISIAQHVSVLAAKDPWTMCDRSASGKLTNK